MLEPIHIEQRNEYEYQVHNLPRNEGIWIQVKNFDVRILRTDEGIVLEAFDVDALIREEPLSSAYAFDNDTASFQVENE